MNYSGFVYKKQKARSFLFLAAAPTWLTGHVTEFRGAKRIQFKCSQKLAECWLKGVVPHG